MTSQGLARRRPGHFAFQPWSSQFGIGPLGQDVGKTMATELYHGGYPPRPVQIPMAWLRGPVRLRMDPPISRAEVSQAGDDAVLVLDAAPVTASILRSVVSPRARSRNPAAVVSGREWVFTATVDSLVSADPANLAQWVTDNMNGQLPRTAAFTLTLNNRTPTEIWTILSVRQGTHISITGAPGPTLSIAADTFGRTVSSGWGSADSGQVWTTSGGSAADYGVSGGLGTMALTSTGVERTAALPTMGATVDVTVFLVPTVLATGAQFEQKVRIRHNGSDFYETNIQYQTSGVVDVYLTRGVTVLSGLAAVLPYSASTTIGVHMQAYGSTIRQRVWDAIGPEPAAWTATVTDADLPGVASDSVMLVADRVAGNTNAGLVVQWDDLTATSPNPHIWPDGATELVVEGITHSITANERRVTWNTAPIIGTTAGVAGPWFYLDDSRLSGTDVVPF